MKGLLHGLAAFPFLASIALAQQPMQLTNQQMDTVTGGHLIIEMSNTSATAVSIFQTAYLLELDAQYDYLPRLLSVDQQSEVQHRGAIRLRF